jgi:alkyldihydroxyacetonephosphate synthase
MGHEPDSLEFSTLGGWVATHASGMKKNKYGNIEDLVLGVKVATPAGQLSRDTILPRESVGADTRRWIFGSEGSLGIVTSATVKIFPLPEVQRYGSIIFPSFEQGFDFLYELTQQGNLPASVRLVDNLQFQFSQALKPRSTGWKVYKSAFERWYVTRLKGFEPQKMVACTLVFEGSKGEVEQQEKSVYGLAKKYGGMPAGSENGERGYQLTFSIAYIRDFSMNYYIIAESFETSVAWSNTLALCDAVKRRIYEEHEKHKLPGAPFITCRITQLYDTGVCVYFYFAFYFKGVENPSEVYAEIEAAARDEILKAGGSLSHHHGIGKLRRKFLPRIMSAPALRWIADVKHSVDPGNIFGCGNLTASTNGAGRDSVAGFDESRKAHGSSSD